MTLHRAAAEGFSQGAEAYQRARPSYPSEVLDWLRDDLGLTEGRRVLEVGAGTGKFTRFLFQTEADIVALEPVAAMREQLKQALPRLKTVDGLAQQLPEPDSSLDAVVCAQSFHWFASREVLSEFRRVLKPGGRLGLVWNYRDFSVSWVAEIDRITRSYGGDAPRFHPDMVRTLFPAEGYGPLREQTVTYTHAGPAETVIVERTMSASFLAALPETRKNEVREQLLYLTKHHPELVGRSTVSFPYETYLFSAEAGGGGVSMAVNAVLIEPSCSATHHLG